MLPADVLERYLSGMAEPHERAAVDAWAASSGRAAALLETLQGTRGDPSPFDTTSGWERVAGRLQPPARDASLGEVPQRPASIARRTIRGRLGRRSSPTVAALGGLLAVILLLRVATHDRGVPSTSREGRSYGTTAGQQAVVVLDDASRIMLAPQSRLVVPASFGSSERTVILEGEAYFEVRAADGAPFIVQTGRVTARVLGTTFVVRRYPGDRITHIAVATGRVDIGSARARTVLSAGTVGIATDSSATKTTGNITPYTEWTHGRLMFTEAPVPQMLATLSRWYGYEFRVADSALVNKVVTGEFRAGELDEALRMLKAALGAHLTFDGKVITLHLNQERPLLRRDRTSSPLPMELGK
jgi:transmembrane sensor